MRGCAHRRPSPHPTGEARVLWDQALGAAPASLHLYRAVAVPRCSQVTLQMPMSVLWGLHRAPDPHDYRPQRSQMWSSFSHTCNGSNARGAGVAKSSGETGHDGMRRVSLLRQGWAPSHQWGSMLVQRCCRVVWRLHTHQWGAKSQHKPFPTHALCLGAMPWQQCTPVLNLPCALPRLALAS